MLLTGIFYTCIGEQASSEAPRSPAEHAPGSEEQDHGTAPCLTPELKNRQP